MAILLVLSIVSFFLPWVTVKVSNFWGEYRSTTNYGYYYIIPLGARYAAPVAILCVIGFILSAYSLKATEKIGMLNVIGGILILIGVTAAFVYTYSSVMTEARGSIMAPPRYVSAEYGIGLEALFGFLMIIFGARAKPKTA